MSEQKTVFNRLFKKEELASQKVELADVATFNKALANAEAKQDISFKGKQLAKDGLLSWKVRSQDALRAFDSVISEYAELIKAAKMLGLEIPANLASASERAKIASAKYKSEFNLAEKLLKQMP
jgi:tetrahydromethanopterin S-methyltransferase subunit H